MQRVKGKTASSSHTFPANAKHFVQETTNNKQKQKGKGLLKTASSPLPETEYPSVDADKLSYEIFSILESKFLFGCDDPRVWISRSPRSLSEPDPSPRSPLTANGVVSPTNRGRRGRICILSIDGGGMRGILAGKSLSYLEDALKRRSGDANARVADFFDVAAGSGIGGVFTAMLFATKDGNRPIFKAEDTWRFLVENAKRFYRPGGVLKRVVMHPGVGSSSATASAATAKLEKTMKEAFHDLTLKDTLKPVLIPCYDLSTTAPFLFSRADALESDSYDFPLREICRATWAEPGTFEPVRTRSIDGKTKCVAVEGGLAMNNPTAAAITHVVHNKQEFPYVGGVQDLLVLSIGTGQMFEVNYNFEQVKNWKVKDWARPMARISGDGAAEFVDQAVGMGFGPYRSTNYVRIQSNGSRLGACGPNLDTDPSSENVRMLKEIAEEMLKQKNVESVLFGSKKIGEMSNAERLDWFAGELVAEHQLRTCRVGPPTVVLKQAVSRSNRNAVNATLNLISKER